MTDENLEHIESLQTAIKDVVASDKVSVQTWWETSPQTKEMMKMQDVSAVLFLGIIFFIAGFGVFEYHADGCI